MDSPDESKSLCPFFWKQRGCVVDSLSLDNPAADFVVAFEEEEGYVLIDEHNPLSADRDSFIVQ